MSAQAPPLNVLLVDDDPDHTLLITHVLRRAAPGTAIETVADGIAALARLEAGTSVPDLVLLDINMPGLSGLEVLARIKAHDGLKRIPVVMLTSSELEPDVARAYELGASGYITKGSFLEDLQAVLGNTLLYWSAMKRPRARGPVAS